VEVKATAIAVDATSSSVGSVVEGKRLLDLPLAAAAHTIFSLPNPASKAN